MKRCYGVLPFIALFVACGCGSSKHRPAYKHYPTVPGVEGGQAEWTYRNAVNAADGENYSNGFVIPLRCHKCGNPVDAPLDLCELCTDG